MSYVHYKHFPIGAKLYLNNAPIFDIDNVISFDRDSVLTQITDTPYTLNGNIYPNNSINKPKLTIDANNLTINSINNVSEVFLRKGTLSIIGSLVDARLKLTRAAGTTLIRSSIPSDIPSVVMWFDTIDTNSIYSDTNMTTLCNITDDNQIVRAWRNLGSAKTRHFISKQRSGYTANITTNHCEYLNFPGDTWLECENTGENDFNIGNGGGVSAIVKTERIDSGSAIFTDTYTPAGRRVQLTLGDLGYTGNIGIGRYHTSWRYASNSQSTLPAINIKDNKYHLLSGLANKNFYRVSIDGTARYSSTGNYYDYINSTTKIYRIGRRWDFDNYWVGKYLCLTVYSDVNVGDLVDGILAWRYDLAHTLPDTHPYKTNKPISTVTDGKIVISTIKVDNT